MKRAPDIRIELDLEMKTRDGVVLRADVVRPDVAHPIPALVCRTPYDKSLRLNAFAHLRPIDAAKAGFAVVFQDVRGRFASEGEWAVMDWDDVERRDGYDTVEWIAAEPWCSGRVGMIGGSYEGLNALAAAAARPPSLGAIAPALLGSADARRTTMMLEGIVVSWSALVALDVLAKRRIGADTDRAGLAKAMSALVDPASAARTLPLAALPPLTIPGMPSYRELTGRLLESSAAIADAVDAIDVPTLWTTGWWDQAGGSDLFRRLRSRAAESRAGAEARIIVGPWSHTQHDVHLGGLGFGQLASLAGGGVGAAHLAFFTRHLRDEETSPLPVVRYFLTGANAWRTSTEWPPPRTSELRLFLSSERGANSVRGDGRLGFELPPSAAPPDRYRYDPADPVPSIGWKALNLGGSTVPGPFDQRRVEARDDVLVYSTEPLEDALEVVGDARLVLHVSTSATDTDFVAKLCDVDLGDVSRNVADGVTRLRWRHGGAEPSFVRPGQVIDVEIDLGMVGHEFRRGHRVRLQIASSAFPHFDRNMNTGRPTGSDREGVPAEQTVHHDAVHPSHLVLPTRTLTSRPAATS